MEYDYLKYKKILIVDDEADLLEMVTSILEQDGFKAIKTAGTVSEALHMCKEWKPDLAILDVMLPDGAEQHLRCRNEDADRSVHGRTNSDLCKRRRL